MVGPKENMFFNFTIFKENEVIYHVDVPVDTSEKHFGKRKDTSDHGRYTKPKPVEYQISLEPFESVAEKRKRIHFEGQNEPPKPYTDLHYVELSFWIIFVVLIIRLFVQD